MKILYFIDHLRPDGTQRVLGQLVRGLAERGHSQTVVCLLEAGAERGAEELQRSGARVVVVRNAALKSGVFAAQLMRLMRREKFDVAVTLLFVADVVGRTLARMMRVQRIVSSIRARNVDYAPWKMGMARETMRWADAVILNSGRVREFAIKNEGVRADRVVVIPNGIRVEPYQRPMARCALDAEFGVGPTNQVIGGVGRLARQKGFDLLIEAVGRLKRTDVEVLILGQGQEEATLREQAKRLGLAERVHFGGYRRDVPQLLGALDIYAHPARFEGMSNAILEAMAAGCPIVTTAVDGSLELLEDGDSGWLVPTEDVGQLANALEQALENRDEARRRGQRAKGRAEHCFSEANMVKRWEQVLANG